MKITEQQVRYVAALANLELQESELSRLQADLESILGHFDKLNEVDTSGVAPMAQVLFDAGETAALREDVPVPCLGSEEALANAALKGGGYFKVPQVIER